MRDYSNFHYTSFLLQGLSHDEKRMSNILSFHRYLTPHLITWTQIIGHCLIATPACTHHKQPAQQWCSLQRADRVQRFSFYSAKPNDGSDLSIFAHANYDHWCQNSKPHGILPSTGKFAKTIAKTTDQDIREHELSQTVQQWCAAGRTQTSCKLKVNGLHQQENEWLQSGYK